MDKIEKSFSTTINNENQHNEGPKLGRNENRLHSFKNQVMQHIFKLMNSKDIHFFEMYMDVQRQLLLEYKTAYDTDVLQKSFTCVCLVISKLAILYLIYYPKKLFHQICSKYLPL